VAVSCLHAPLLRGQRRCVATSTPAHRRPARHVSHAQHARYSRLPRLRPGPHRPVSACCCCCWPTPTCILTFSNLVLVPSHLTFSFRLVFPLSAGFVEMPALAPRGGPAEGRHFLAFGWWSDEQRGSGFVPGTRGCVAYVVVGLCPGQWHLHTCAVGQVRLLTHVPATVSVVCASAWTVECW
jgi:hypothetical protein